jgi:D-inositol-3-phosphate glycosyltransferase
VTFVGKVHLTKGPHLAIQAADLARRATGLPVRVRVIGDGSYGHGGRTPHETWLREQVSTIATPVDFIPFQERAELARHLAESAVVCLPSRAETFWLVTAEAMAAGVPVVCSHLPALREVGGGAPVHVPREDLGAMAEAIADLLEDRERWAAASAAGGGPGGRLFP